MFMAGTAGSLLRALACAYTHRTLTLARPSDASSTPNPSPTLPSPQPRFFTAGEVRASSDRKLVTFRGGVFDVTDFAAVHPGGDEIDRAFGGRLERYFALFPHHLRADVLDLLEELRIGSLAPEEGSESSRYDVDMSPDGFRVEVVVRDLKPRLADNVTANTSSAEEVSSKVEVLTETFSIADLVRSFHVRQLEVGVACGLGPWRGRWAEELAHRGGAKVHEGVWLGDVLLHLVSPAFFTRRRQPPASTEPAAGALLAGTGGTAAIPPPESLDRLSLDGLNLEGLFVHYHCFDDYVDSVPLADCLRDVRTSLLVFKRGGERLSTDLPFPGGGPLMALTPGSGHYPCDAKWITKIVVSADPQDRHGGKYTDQADGSADASGKSALEK